MARDDASVRVLVAADGSAASGAAVAVALAFPWPPGTQASGVVARGGWMSAQATAEWATPVGSALDESLERIRRAVKRTLARRWPAAEVALVDRSPVVAILDQARAVGADTIVMGSRGYGPLGRFVLGSVSRGVVRGAECPVLVVKRRPRSVRHLLLGLDGSANAERAVAFVARLTPPRGGRVTVVRVVEPVRMPSMALMPASIRAAVSGEATKVAAESRRAAQRDVDTAARRLAQAGWKTRMVVRVGVPLPELLRSIKTAGADVLVLGARGVGGVERLLLGSVAEGALTRAAVPVLLVR